MQTVVYDGTFNGWLCAVFDVYEYKYKEVEICAEQHFQNNVFNPPHFVTNNEEHSKRVWKGLEGKLSKEALHQVYRTFLSQIPGIENTLLQYVQYAFASAVCMEEDYSNAAVLAVKQTAKKVYREKHRMEAFVRFQKTKDELYYAIIEPDFNVLPIIAEHFKKRYADQKWIIYDGKRKWGLFYDGFTTSEVALDFKEDTGGGKNISAQYDESETIYQDLWQQYFKSVNIAARKNTKLHIKHMPLRYWKYLPEKRK